ncbi:MAG: dihydrofolate reductase family protein [Solirubrobacterales bacterium]
MSAEQTASRLTRIHPPAPDAPTIDAREAYAQLDFAARASDARPYVIVNMVSTVDGQGRIGNDTAELGDAADAAMFATLRERVDCVMAGVRTIGIEQYNAPARGEDVQQRRADAGLADRPIVTTLTRSGDLPLEAPLFADPGLRVVVFSGRQIDLTEVAAQVEVVVETDPAAMLRVLRERFGVRSLLLEGGPHINQPFLAEELVDEFFLTVAPVLTGSDMPFPIVAGALPSRQKLHLIGALVGDEHLFLRYRVD